MEGKNCTNDNKQQSTQKKRPHFTIDWRQLTYYRPKQKSIFGCLDSKEKNNKHLKQQIDEDEFNNFLDNRLSSGENKLILNSLDGRFKSGQLSAILGPSGAGKSTFLSALFGNKQENAFGQTKVTWFEDCHHRVAIDSHIKQRPIRIAFLPQHDHLLNHLSVYETLMFASKIKNATRLKEMNMNANERAKFHRSNVRRVSKMLKLVECLQTRCGLLSGGQYKRVSIGQELLSEPDVIILDEPTSGLDAMTCLTTVRTLKSIATKHPISIILTIHQPDIDVFNLFDQVYVIAQGGRAIYEGPPQELAGTLARADLHMPNSNYNPARFIVENAFITPPESSNVDNIGCDSIENNTNCPKRPQNDTSEFGSEEDDNDDDDHVFVEETLSDDEVDQQRSRKDSKIADNILKRSISSLNDIFTGTKGNNNNNNNNDSPLKQSIINMSPLGSNNRLRESGRKPLLLNIGGVKTSDGKLITSNQLGLVASDINNLGKKWREDYEEEKLQRLKLLERLNEIQKAKYYPTLLVSTPSNAIDNQSSKTTSFSGESENNNDSSTTISGDSDTASEISMVGSSGNNSQPTSSRPCSVYSSNKLTSDNDEAKIGFDQNGKDKTLKNIVAGGNFIVNLDAIGDKNCNSQHAINSDQADDGVGQQKMCTFKQESLLSTTNHSSSGIGSTISNFGHHHHEHSSCSNSNSLRTSSGLSHSTFVSGIDGNRNKLKRQFDKRLSAKHSNSKHKDYPIIYHSYLLTHRTWLSIVRDPIFFGIQFCMHTTIPILLALIFGSHQEEGCPRLGQFDLVDFAYQQDSDEFFRGTMLSIRQSIGNIGVVFFEMFVLCFAINCITALVFPIDMHVLLKEYRNSWYSLRSYFIGRTLADLPVPIVLHSMAMAILCYMTAQPLDWWRFGVIVLIVIFASLVAQSVGLTIGALLMQSSQSAVLAAAGIVAPFFALSGFIVRIHTLSWVAQLAAKSSYLYHLLNGFIIMRYGFSRCPCDETSDFGEQTKESEHHQMPHNLKTMASMWIGTFSDEYESVAHKLIDEHSNRTNVDPNIDVVGKLTDAFKTANSYGHKVESCQDALPYALLDFNLRDGDIWACCISLLVMLLLTRLLTFAAIYYKVRSSA